MSSLVHVKNPKNGITYVYESFSYWDRDKQQARNRRTCIGKLDPETGEFIPSKRLAGKGEAAAPKPGPVPSVSSKRLFYGATHLLDCVAEHLGVRDDLRACFPDSYTKILSLAYFLVLEDRNPVSRFSRWARTHVHPFGRDIPSQRSSELLGSISEDAKQSFFRLQASRRLETEFLSYDTTSISSYSRLLKQVKYGRNKEHDLLPQINLALLFGQNSRLPVYYRKLPGNITDVKTVQHLLASIDFLDLKKVRLIMDRGFYSEANINALYQKHYKFLIGAKTSLRLVQPYLDEARKTIVSRSHYSSTFEVYYKSQTITWNYREIKPRTGQVVKEPRRLYLHLYYNDQQATDDKMVFNQLLDSLEEELLQGPKRAEHEKLYDQYYTVKTTPVRGTAIVPNDEAIEAVERNYGYFALLSNGIKDPLEALDIYRNKDLIEKAFGNLKERLNMRRTTVSSEENLDGKLFVQFVSLILLSHINRLMSERQLRKTFTLQEALDELDVIERYTQPGRRPYVGEITAKQTQLFEKFEVSTPT